MSNQRYTPAFMDEAVRLVDQSEDPIADIVKELGIKPSLLYLWRQIYSRQGETMRS